MRRVPEAVLVFMEYRDTLALVARMLRPHVAFDVLHGALAPAERERSLRGFVSGRTRVLLATDAASEGLNLHRCCRTTIMLDVPWTPTRLEQRIGRLDRLGQRRRVHAVALVSSDFDDVLTRRLEEKRDRAAALLMRPATRGFDVATMEAMADIAMTRLAIRRNLLRALGGPDSPSASADPGRAGTRMAESPAAPGLLRAWLEPSPRPSHWSGAIVLVDALLRQSAAVIDRAVIGLHIPIVVPRLGSRAEIRRFVDRHLAPLESPLIARAREHLISRWDQSRTDHHAYGVISSQVRVAIARPGPVHTRNQPSLFGRYADAGQLAPAASVNDLSEDVVMDEGEPVERISIVMICLRTGPGRRPEEGERWKGERLKGKRGMTPNLFPQAQYSLE